jgi:hypothetical protein
MSLDMLLTNMLFVADEGCYLVMLSVQDTAEGQALQEHSRLLAALARGMTLQEEQLHIQQLAAAAAHRQLHREGAAAAVADDPAALATAAAMTAASAPASGGAQDTRYFTAYDLQHADLAGSDSEVHSEEPAAGSDFDVVSDDFVDSDDDDISSEDLMSDEDDSEGGGRLRRHSERQRQRRQRQRAAAVAAAAAPGVRTRRSGRLAPAAGDDERVGRAGPAGSAGGSAVEQAELEQQGAANDREEDEEAGGRRRRTGPSRWGDHATVGRHLLTILLTAHDGLICCGMSIVATSIHRLVVCLSPLAGDYNI